MKCLYCNKELEKLEKKAVIDLGVEPYCSQYCAEVHGACAEVPGSDSEKDIEPKIYGIRIHSKNNIIKEEKEE